MSTTPAVTMPQSPSATSPVPEIDPGAPLLFIINAASGQNDADTTRQLIEDGLRVAGRTGELLFTPRMNWHTPHRRQPPRPAPDEPQSLR